MDKTNRLPKYKRADEAPPIQLNERDVRILEAVLEYRFLTSAQIQKLLFGSSTRANTRLQKLYHNGYLDRVFLPTVLGSSPAIYCLDKKGAALLEDITGQEVKFDKRRNVLSHNALAHSIAINDARISLVLTCEEDVDILEYKDELAARVSYKTFNSNAGRDIKRTFSPDAFFRLQVNKGILTCFVELDRGNQDQKRKLKRKLKSYLEFLNSGSHSRHFGGKLFRTLFIIDPKWKNVSIENKRLHNLKALAEELGAEFVWLTTLPELKDKGFFKAIWYKAGEEGPKSFI